MRVSAAPLFVMAALASTSPVLAQLEPQPTIEVIDAERTVDAGVTADSAEDEIATTYTAIGPWVDSAFMHLSGEFGSSGTAEADQGTRISDFSISGEGWVEANASRGGGEDADARAAALSNVVISFIVPVDAPYSLSGSFTATGDAAGTCFSSGNVGLTAILDNQVQFQLSHSFDCHGPPEDAAFFFDGTILAGTTLYLTIQASVFMVGNDIFDLTGQGAASFDFGFDLGDRDGDGLLDIWETEGIDLDGMAPPDIDLPGMGADPDKKDLFVEVDVMSGIIVDEAAFAMVEQAFAQAPASMVDNPDGSTGIQLHVIWNDGDSPPSQPFVDPFSGTPSQIQTLKDDYFGTSAERSRGDREELMAARRKVFRYCVVGESLVHMGESLTGLAETPGDDFVVVVGPLLHSQQATEGLAGFFMHELGHNLGLHHGGVDEQDFKPNYLSIMNFSYMVPWLIDDPQGNSFADYWRLDYSRSAPRTLDENGLLETAGLNGPSGRAILFNSAQTSPSVKTFGWANSQVVDWNNSGDIDPDPYPLEIARMLETQDIAHDILDSYTDWDRLWYHLSGYPTFGGPVPTDPGSLRAGMSLADIEDFVSGEWVNQIALGDLIFENGFELGSTTAWSTTTP